MPTRCCSPPDRAVGAARAPCGVSRHLLEAIHRDLDVAPRGRAAARDRIDEKPAMRPTSTFFSTDSRFTRLWCWKIIATLRREQPQVAAARRERRAVDDDLAAARRGRAG